MVPEDVMLVLKESLSTYVHKAYIKKKSSCISQHFSMLFLLSEGHFLGFFTQAKSLRTRGATDRRWSVIRTDQSPRFGTHVIRGLTDKFNHHRVKVYHLHVLRFLRSAAAAHAEARTCRERAWEREAWFRYRVSDNASTDGYIHTKLC